MSLQVKFMYFAFCLPQFFGKYGGNKALLLHSYTIPCTSNAKLLSHKMERGSDWSFVLMGTDVFG